jgi:hypothetical protein
LLAFAVIKTAVFEIPWIIRIIEEQGAAAVSVEASGSGLFWV